MFEIGQKVKFVDQTGWGKIIAIEENRILVHTNDGLELFFLPKKIIPYNDKNEIYINTRSKEVYEKISNDKKKAKKNVKEKNTTAIPEIDLHIENLLDNWQKLSNFEILTYQMNVFKRLLEKFMEKKTTRLIVIHGKGEGVLRNKIRHYLLNYPNIEFLDGSYLNYGIGATEIIIRYNY